MIELIYFKMHHFLQGVILSMIFIILLTMKLNILGILSKFSLSLKGLNVPSIYKDKSVISS